MDPALGVELRRLRIAKGMTLSSLSRAVNFSKGHLSNVERGTRQATEDLIRRCVAVLGVEGELIHMLEERPPIGGDSARDLPGRRRLPAQLPPSVTDFVGRAGQLAELDWHLESAGAALAPQVLLFDGAAGSGKTTLALWWAHRIRGRFPDGAMYADLHGFDATEAVTEAGEILDRFIQDLGVPAADVPGTLDARMALFRTLVDGRRLLFVLDNAASYDQVRPLLPGSAGSLVLVTSRSRLPGLVVREGARRVEVGPFTQDESGALLREALGAQRIAAEPAAAAELAEICGHQPLALRIVAFHAASNSKLKISDVVDELRSGRNRLELLDTVDDSAAIRAAFSWSYRTLPSATARIFGLIGLHPSESFSAAAVAALSGHRVAAMQKHLSLLRDLHMIEELRPNRFIIQGLLHLYAAECLEKRMPKQEQGAAVERMFHWYLRTADAADRKLAARQERLPLPEIDHPAVEPLRFDSRADALAWCEDMLETLWAVCRKAADLGVHVVARRLPPLLSEAGSGDSLRAAGLVQSDPRRAR